MTGEHPPGSLEADVIAGLTASAKRMPPYHFYDQQGSELFERITELPEYYLTDSEREILQAYADDIVARAGDDIDLVELGAGSASKTRILIDALLRCQGATTYYPVDISASAIEEAAVALRKEFPDLEVTPVVGRYSDGVKKLAGKERRCLVLFIGSSVGNFEPGEATRLLADVQRAMQPGDAFLLGVDLVKDPGILVPAYDDAARVTEAFNKNVLARVNRELGGEFDLSTFRHVAEWNPEASRMQMFLESTIDQSVRVRDLDITVHLRAGERIHTENSYKFTEEMVDTIAREAGFQREASWTDARGWFAVHLMRKPPATRQV